MSRTPLLPILAVLALPSSSGAETYVDVTTTAGLAVVQHVPNDPPDCLLGGGLFCEPERMTGGVAVGDVDGDGWDDVYVTRLGAADRLFRNEGDGTFDDVTSAAGLDGFVLDTNGALFFDADKDGDLDLYVTTLGDVRNYLFVNGGTGAFSEEALARGAAVATGETHVGYGLAVGDYDRDGWPDLFVSEWRPPGLAADPNTSHSRLLRNLGPAQPGHFEDTTQAAGVQVAQVIPTESWVFAPAFVDLDGDGWQDLALAADFGTSLLFWNQGDGTFLEGTAAAGVGTDENGMGSTFGDWDGDGDLDWFVTSIYDPAESCETTGCGWGYSGNRLYRNDGGRSFSDATGDAGVRDGAWGWGAAFFDGDNDGDLDLAMTNGVDFPDVQVVPPTLDDPWETDAMRYWRNDGAGVGADDSVAVGLAAQTGSGKGLLTFDYDHDGDLDLLVADNATGPVLLRNDGGSGQAALRVRPCGTTSTRSAWGARVSIRPWGGGAELQFRVIGASSHFLGQSERVAHFGLGPPGSADPVYRVRVEFPSGRTVETLLPPSSVTVDVWEHSPRRCGLLGIEACVALAGVLAVRRRVAA